MMNKDTPHFSPQELRAIYAAAAEKTKDGMSAAARALYPAREDALKTLYWLRRRPGVSLQRRKLQQAGFYTAVLAR